MAPLGYTPPSELKGVSVRALLVGVVFSGLLLIGLILGLVSPRFSTAQFFQSYLVGFVFWIGITLGSLALLMLQHLTGGAWGLVIRRVLEASTRTLPLMLLLFIPIIFGLKQIYPWTNSAFMRETPALQQKAQYLHPSFFIMRSAIYFAFWSLLALTLNWLSLEQDRTGQKRIRKRLQMVSGPGLVFLIISITFAAIDWVMSLEPEWSSTIFGLIFVAAWSLSALAFTIIVMSWLQNRGPMDRVAQPRHFHDWGNLLLALVMLWTYFAFSQYLIIWSGNLAEETTWYVARTRGGWGAIALLIVILQFAFPFLALLSRASKKSAEKLAILAGLILVMRVVDVIWLIEPAFHRESFHLSWMDIVAPIGIGGLWVGTFAWQLQKRALVPLNDPQLEQALEQVHEH
ncbi:MAG TPA: hypothetical protein VE961_22985 [Pyrinomonadaceae bacterium]|nr:hypothetical protein [Pyrinomonadaceae bacterium]